MMTFAHFKTVVSFVYNKDADCMKQEDYVAKLDYDSESEGIIGGKGNPSLWDALHHHIQLNMVSLVDDPAGWAVKVSVHASSEYGLTAVFSNTATMDHIYFEMEHELTEYSYEELSGHIASSVKDMIEELLLPAALVTGGRERSNDVHLQIEKRDA